MDGLALGILLEDQNALSLGVVGIVFKDDPSWNAIHGILCQNTIGSQLIVEESQQAVFFRDGKALDTFGPGRHTLATQNIPILASIFGLPFGGESPFQAAVVFVSTKTFLDLKWGTKESVIFRDRELAMVLVTHNLELAERADRILHLEDGRLQPRPRG